MLKHAAVLLTLALPSACATSSGASSEADPVLASGSAPARRSGTSAITLSELQDPRVASLNALDVVRQLRPAFLNSRAAGGLDAKPHNVLVSIDGGALSPLTMLQSVQTAQLQEISFLNSTDAAQRFGTTTTGGPVILVTTRRH